MADLLERIQDRALQLGVLLNLHIDLTYRCNERCVHCYLDHNSRDELSVLDLKRVFAEARGLGTLFLTISGGEPMLRPDFFDILKLACSSGFAVKLKTNGTMIHDAESSIMRDLGVQEVQISVYASEAELHDRITKLPGSFERSLSAIRLLHSKNVRVVIADPLMKANVADYQKVRELAQQLGVRFTFDPTITPMINGDLDLSGQRISRSSLRSLYGDPSLVGDAEEFCRPPAPSSDILESVPCSAGHSSAYITPNGAVTPCVQFPFECGNVRRDSLAAIWRESPQFLEVRSIRLKDLPTCSSCELIAGCTRCPGLAHMEGNLRGPSSIDCEKSAVRFDHVLPAPLIQISTGSPA